VRRTLVNLVVAATSLGVLAASWVGVGRADEGRRVREAAERDAAALATSSGVSGDPGTAPGAGAALSVRATVPTNSQPTGSAGATPTATATTANAPASATAVPQPAVVAGASFTAPSVTVTPPAPGLIPAPAATAAAVPTLTATAAAVPTLTATAAAVPTLTATPAAAPTAATPRRIVRPSRAS